MKIYDKIIKINKEKNKEIAKLLDNKNILNIKFDDNKLLLYHNNKLIIVGSFNFFGIYQQDTKLWIWASSIPGVNVKHIKYINKIREFSYLFEKDDDPKTTFYYQFLTQDTVYIIDNVMLNWINELLIYLSDDIYYFNPINTNNNMQFITLSKIKEKYI